MKVLQLANCFHSTPLYANLFRALSGIGVRQDIYCAAKSSHVEATGASWAHDLNFKTSHLVTRSDRILFRSKVRKIARHVNESFDLGSYDLIHAHTLYSDGAVARDLGITYGIPYVVAFRNTDVNYFRRLRPDLRWLEKGIVADAGRLFSISHAYADRYEKAFSKSITTIPNGIDDIWFERAKLTGDAEDGDAGEVKILSVSDLSPNKNATRLIEAVQLARSKTGRDFRLTFVGGAADRVDYYRHYLQHRNYSFVRMTGRVEDRIALRRLYAAHDIFALPSRFETFGLTYVEALSQGLPIICSKGQGVDGYFDNDAIMQAVDSGDVADIANGVITLSNNFAQARNSCIGEAARFRWPEIAQQYYVEYNKVLSWHQ